MTAIHRPVASARVPHVSTRGRFPGRRAALPLLSAVDSALFDEAENDRGESVTWSQDEIVMLHGVLFDTCVDALSNPDTPLDEVLDCMRWIFSEPGREAEPFSFASTLALYQRPNARHVREALRQGLKGHLDQRLARYPAWVAEAFWSDPDRFSDELERNPQRINEAVRRVARAGDLFSA